MSDSEDRVEKIKTNYEKFEALCARLGDRWEPVKALLEHFGNRLALAPASVHVDYHNAFEGGLIDHSLRVLQNASKLAKVYELKISKESLILTCLFHDLGKVGDLGSDLYQEQTNRYQTEKGWRYEYNSDCSFMSVAHRSLWLLQHFGVQLTYDEYLAILLSAEQSQEETTFYKLKEPTLAAIIQMADRMSCLQEKEANKVTPM